MKANDVFIVSAVAMKLINKFIWIKPSWVEGAYINQTVVVGITDEFKDSFGTQLCVCEDFEKLKMSEIRSKHECEVLHHKRASVKTIQYSKCLIKTEYRYYEVSEKYAVKLLTAIRKTEKTPPKVILDIDEDYFGVENRLKAYLKAGGQIEDVFNTDKAMEKVFCPKTGGNTEKSGNEFMLKYLRHILTQCHSGEQECTKDEVLEIGNKLKKKLNENLISKLFCRTEDFQSEFIKLGRILWSYSKYTLKGLMKLRFCNFGIPTLGYGVKFRTCKGVPENDAVDYHMPTKKEAKNRAKRLNHIISFIHEKYSTPGVTTICRSVRDGYTPLRHFQSIEKYITDGLKNATAGTDQLKFHYDDKLLFGSHGWKTDEQEPI